MEGLVIVYMVVLLDKIWILIVDVCNIGWFLLEIFEVEWFDGVIGFVFGV